MNIYIFIKYREDYGDKYVKYTYLCVRMTCKRSKKLFQQRLEVSNS